jgi:hypothetical protein
VTTAAQRLQYGTPDAHEATPTTWVDQNVPMGPKGGYDVFLSHASEDKMSFVLPLVDELERRGIIVWLDHQQLMLGDSLSEKIDEGLSEARFGVVVLSHAFFAKRWPRRELDGLVTRETTSDTKVILPVWHGVTAEDVAKYSPTLAGRLAAHSDAGIRAVADQIERVLNESATVEPHPRSAKVRVPSVGQRSDAPDPSADTRISGLDTQSLTLEADFSFQTPMGLTRPPSSRIDWKPSFKVIYTGDRVLRISDVVPMPPSRTADQDGRDLKVDLVRVSNKSFYEAYPSYGDIIAAQSTRTHEGDLLHAEEWPLVLKPGDRLRLILHHEYEFHLDGHAVTFDDNEQLLQMLGPYFDLERAEDGGYLAGARKLPTRIVSNAGEWVCDVTYGTYVVGVQLKLPGPEVLEDILGPPQTRRLRWPFRRG